MLKKSTAGLLTFAFVLFLTSPDLIAQTRIKFRRGTSSATRRGGIAPNGYKEYVIDGRAGQVMSINIKSGNGKVIVNAGSASGKNFSLDMSGGDHLLSIVNTGNTGTTYTLTVSIR